MYREMIRLDFDLIRREEGMIDGDRAGMARLSKTAYPKPPILYGTNDEANECAVSS